MSVTVAVEGNRRKGQQNIEELVQCIQDIKTCFVRSGCEPNLGASNSDLQRLQKAMDVDINEDINLYFAEVNGGIWFMDKIALSTEEIISICADLDSSNFWKSDYFPFCGDASSLLIINKRGEVLEWDDEDGCGDIQADSFSDFLEKYRNSLLGGRHEFIADIGVVEKMSSHAPSNRK